MPTKTPQARYWLLTIPHYAFTPYLPPDVAYIRGQLEQGEQRKRVLRNPDCACSPCTEACYTHATEGYLHWQVLVIFKRKLRLGGLKAIFGPSAHAEPSRSDAANDYVWKEDTRVPGTQFELGSTPVQRGRTQDWDAIKEAAKRGRLDDIPGDIFVRNYGNLKRIAVDHCEPVAVERTVHVLWGPTGVGKSRRAWAEAGLDAYPKDPRSKFWDGYRGQEHVVIDEFRGDIDIGHVLRWFDRYPVIVEVKGSSVVLKATTIWITSNLSPSEWYPNLDEMTRAALMRRLNVTECPLPLY